MPVEIIGKFRGPSSENLKVIVALAEFIIYQKLTLHRVDPQKYQSNLMWEVKSDDKWVNGDIQFPAGFEIHDDSEGREHDITDLVKKNIQDRIVQAGANLGLNVDIEVT